MILIVLIAAAAILYPALSDRYSPPADPGTGPVDSSQPKEAADFTAYDGDGNAVKLSDFAGKPVVVNFWATWCPPCRSELPSFDAAFAEYGDGVAFMMVDLADGSRETVEGAQQFVSENGYNFPVYYDTEFDGVQAYGVSTIPLTLFVKADGTLLAKRIGAMDHETLMGYMEELTGGNSL